MGRTAISARVVGMGRSWDLTLGAGDSWRTRAPPRDAVDDSDRLEDDSLH